MDEITKHIINQILTYLLTGGGILAIIRAILWMQGLKIVSFYRIYRHKERFLNHAVFTKLRDVLHSKYFIANIKDIPKKKIAEDLIFLEILRIRQVLNSSLQVVFQNNLAQYVRTFPKFSSDYIVKLFINDYINRERFEKLVRARFTRHGYMTQQDFNKFWSVYSESVNIYEIFLYESLNMLSNKKNIYEVLWNALDKFDILIETEIKTIASELNKLNARLSGISYKGYVIE